LIAAMFKLIYERLEKYKYQDLEGGTIMEQNVKSIGVFRKLNGRIVKTFRIYGKEITL
jgi:hypothetical protein